MPQLRRSELEFIITQVKQKASAEWIHQLKAFKVLRGRVAHFGCASGSETLALMWMLDACEACGIDRDIAQAERTLVELREWMEESRLALPYISQDDRSWWENAVPDFLKEQRFPTFIEERDIARPVKPFQLPCDHYDLACCSNLLYQILDNQGEPDVRSAVKEMRRVAKPGAWIVVDEPDNGDSARFTSLLGQANLELLKTTTLRVGWPKKAVTATTYYCRKPWQ